MRLFCLFQLDFVSAFKVGTVSICEEMLAVLHKTIYYRAEIRWPELICFVFPQLSSFVPIIEKSTVIFFFFFLIIRSNLLEKLVFIKNFLQLRSCMIFQDLSLQPTSLPTSTIVHPASLQVPNVLLATSEANVEYSKLSHHQLLVLLLPKFHPLIGL